MSMTALNPGLIFPEDLSGPAGTGSGDNELVLWRAIKALQAQLAGANSPLVAFFGDGSPNGTEFIGNKVSGCAGNVLILGPQFQITTGDQVLNVDAGARQVGVNTCTPTFALDINEQNCDSKVVAVRGPTSDVDEDFFPNFCPTPVARIRVHNTGDCSGPMQFFIADATHTLNEVMELKVNKQVEFFGQIQIDGGSPGSGKVLTSDSNGLATWQAASSGGFTQAVRVTKSASQSISNNTDTALTWNTETFDTNGLHDNAVNNSRLTAQVAGKYQVSGGARFDTNGTGRRQLYIKKNGTSIYSLLEPAAPNASVPTVYVITGLVDLAVGDYVELWVFQNSGGALDLTASFSETHFEMAQVSG